MHTVFDKLVWRILANWHPIRQNQFQKVNSCPFFVFTCFEQNWACSDFAVDFVCVWQLFCSFRPTILPCWDIARNDWEDLPIISRYVPNFTKIMPYDIGAKSPYKPLRCNLNCNLILSNVYSIFATSIH